MVDSLDSPTVDRPERWKLDRTHTRVGSFGTELAWLRSQGATNGNSVREPSGELLAARFQLSHRTGRWTARGSSEMSVHHTHSIRRFIFPEVLALFYSIAAQADSSIRFINTFNFFFIRRYSIKNGFRAPMTGGRSEVSALATRRGRPAMG